MKATGIVRNIDDLGRLVIPSELRKTHGIKLGDPIEIYTEEDRIVIKKYEPIIPDELSIPNLKNMDGKPVWVVPEKNPIEYADDVSKWMIIDFGTETLINASSNLAFCDIPGNYKLYAKEW